MNKLLIACALVAMSAPAAVAAPLSLPSIPTFTVALNVPVYAPRSHGGVIGANVLRWLINHIG